MRVVVTATNAGGSASATSAQTGSVAVLPPTAAFSDSASASVTGQTVHFDASASQCYATPCTYTWADEPPSGGSWPLGTGQTIDFTFQGAGTKYVTLAVTDAENQSATIEHDVVVTHAPSPVPSNTVLPAISGTTTQGQTLTHDQRHLDRQPDRLRLPVARLRQFGQQLRQHQRRHQQHLHPD